MKDKLQSSKSRVKRLFVLLNVSVLIACSIDSISTRASAVAYRDSSTPARCEMSIYCSEAPPADSQTIQKTSAASAAATSKAQSLERQETERMNIDSSLVLSIMTPATASSHTAVPASNKKSEVVVEEERASTAAIIGGVEKDEIVRAPSPIVIDNDEVSKASVVNCEQPQTNADKTKVIAGAKFPVVIASQVNSKTAKAGDPIEARLKNDLLIGERLIAHAGSVITGHIDYVLKARTPMRALISSERWYKNAGCLGIVFDEIINEKGEHVPIAAKPAKQSNVINNKGEGRLLGVNNSGQIVEPWSNQLKYKAIRIGLHAAMAPAGVFSFGAMPVALGVIGAVNPSFGYMKPVGLNVRHRRIKGFALGFLGGVPGGIVVQDSIIKGQEAVIEPGDEIVAEFKEEFTGESASENSVLVRASGDVHGQVLPKVSAR